MKILSFLLSIFLLIACQQKENSETAQTTPYEAFRSQFHFTPKTGWMNDPNGMVYYEGEYHLC